MKKIMAFIVIFTTAVSAFAGGDKQQSGGAGKGAFTTTNSAYAAYDLSKPLTLYMYMLGDVPKDMNEVLDKANKEYFQPMLNTTLKLVFLAWSDYMTKYPLILAAGENVDIIFTAPWAFYEQESAKGSYLELTTDFIAQWMPNVAKSMSKIAWQQAVTGGKIYGVPTNFSALNHKHYAIREDLRTKHNLPEPNSWDNLEKYLFTIAANEPSIQAYAAAAEAPEVLFVYLNAMNVLASGEPIYFAWKNVNRNEPKPEELFFLYTSDWFRDFSLEMAEWFQKGVWSRNVMNNTIAQGDSFTQGKSASVFWNASVYSLGKTMEDNGVGKAGYYEANPTVPTRKESYDNNMWAITALSSNTQRSALTLDLIKTNRDLNMLLRGGIIGRHYIPKEAGTYERGAESDDYVFDGWTWAMREEGMNEVYDTVRYAQRYALDKSTSARAFEPLIDGFRFDRKKVSSEWAVISSLIEEYTPSFECGVYGNDTQAKFNEFKAKCEAAGLNKLITEFRTQYTAFLKNN
ncbi:MAG: ABC transporter substrate-binding protein [Spirochaetaceae bacterium]|jgi:putative aldouronate transport system substrate-binding protein|nr:ABC transporter substrate-binding protein [Spirochaetaceae bacterium]